MAPTDDIDVGTPVLSVGYPGSTDQVTGPDARAHLQGRSDQQREDPLGWAAPRLRDERRAVRRHERRAHGRPRRSRDRINSFNIRGETEAFNYITPVSLVSEMLARNGVTNELGPIDEAYQAGVEAFYAGDLQAAVDSLDEALALAPTHQQARR